MDREQLIDHLLSSDSSCAYDAIFLADDFFFQRTHFPIIELTSATLDEEFAGQVEPITSLNPTISEDHTCVKNIETQRLKAVLYQPLAEVPPQPYDKIHNIVKPAEGTSKMDPPQATDTRDQKPYASSQRIVRTPQANVSWLSKEDQHISHPNSILNDPRQASPGWTPSGAHERLLTAEDHEDLALLSLNTPNHKDPPWVHLSQSELRKCESLSYLEALSAEVTSLRQQNSSLQRQLESKQVPLSPRWQLLHRVYCTSGKRKGKRIDISDIQPRIFEDLPKLKNIVSEVADNRVEHLIGNTEIFSLERYKNANPDIIFIVFYDYECCQSIPRAEDHGDVGRQDSFRKSFSIISEILLIGLRSLTGGTQQLMELSPNFELGRDVFEPFTFFFHYQTEIRQELPALPKDQYSEVALLIDYVSTAYAKAEEIFSRGLVSGPYLAYLFPPNQIVIWQSKEAVCGYFQTSDVQITRTDRLATDSEIPSSEALEIDVEFLVFDGCFRRSAQKLEFKYPDKSRGRLIRIDELEVFPLAYAPSQVLALLQRRSQTFWACRAANYVNYSGYSFDGETHFTDARFMVDVATWRRLHGRKQTESTGIHAPAIDFSDKDSPERRLLLTLPRNIYGFHMLEKKWINLAVDSVLKLEWNKSAFETLVIDDDVKELITALVSNKLAADKNTDHIAGKGTGLVVLLHGGPGTGKTLTAETVAEIAEKPLYRVTCGDIGTEPVQIEKYLESVFQLGKLWDCVVLLDEADVFLEQRTLSDLARNAIVSVFLRVLEYYDGILLLTSNRVGTFDEAFKSRIQLSIHYENLNLSQRKKIWENFIERLDALEENVDISDLRSSIKELASHKLNGRQIRNAITTARQLASFKAEQMDINHLRRVLKVSAKFDKYILDIQDGVTDEEIAREDRRR